MILPNFIKPTTSEMPTQLDLFRTLPDGVSQRARQYYSSLMQMLFPEDRAIFIDSHSHCGIGEQKQHDGSVRPITPNLSGWVEAMTNYHYPFEEVHKYLATFHNDWKLTDANVSNEEKAAIVAGNTTHLSETVRWFLTRVLMEYGAHEIVQENEGKEPADVTLEDMLKPENREELGRRISTVAEQDPTGRLYLEGKGVRAMVMTNDVPDILDAKHHIKYPWFVPSARIDHLLAKIQGDLTPKQMREQVFDFFERIIVQHKGAYGAASLPPGFCYFEADESTIESLRHRTELTLLGKSYYTSFILKSAFEAAHELSQNDEPVPMYLFAGVQRKAFSDQVATGGQDFGGHSDVNMYIPLFEQFPDVRVVFKPYDRTDAKGGVLVAADLKPNFVSSPVWWFNHNFESMRDIFTAYFTRVPPEAWIPGESDAYRVQFFVKLEMTLMAYAAAAASVFPNENRFLDVARIQWLEGPERVFPRLQYS